MPLADVAQQKREDAEASNPAGSGTGFGAIFGFLIQLIQSLFGGNGPGGLFGSLSGLFGSSQENADQSGGRASRQSSVQPGLTNVPLEGFNSAAALNRARNDNAGVGDCAKGVANILQSQGYNITRGNAHDWKESLPENGWVRLTGVNARNAPEGAVLVFDSDVNKGRSPRNNGGGKFGHVEVVCYDAQGNRLYVSDKARENIGGSVPNNFVGAYIPAERYAAMQRQNANPDTMIADARTTAPASRNTSVASALDGNSSNGATSRQFSAAANGQEQVALNTPAPSVTGPRPRDYTFG